MEKEKIFSTTDEQLAKLRSRGMIIANEDKAKRIIQMENYYKLINGYKSLFLNPPQQNAEETYKKGTQFEEIYALYLFDRELRNLFMHYILEIENNIKSVLAHDFSKKYGHRHYLKISNFNTHVQASEKKTAAQKIGDISNLISKLQQEIARQLSKNNPMISHYMLEYGYVPLWVLVNTLPLGTISIFYSHLTQKDQNDIGRYFLLKPEDMNRFLQLLTIYRNACAHDERLYNLKALRHDLQPNSIRTMPLHRKLHIPTNSSNNPIYGKNDLFAIALIFKTMLPKSSFHKFYAALNEMLDALSTKLFTISITEIKKQMGFPDNWTDIKNL